MIKSYQRWKQVTKEKYKVPKSVQDTIPIDVVYEDGVFKCGKTYTKCFKFLDVNYHSTSRESKNHIMLNYGEILSSFDSSVSIKISVNNRKIDLDEFSKNILIPLEQDERDIYRKDYNKIILDKLSETDNIIQEKYLTVTAYKNNIKDARTFFNRVANDLSNRFARIGSVCVPLNARERLKILHDFYRGNEELFVCDLKDMTKKGHSFKDRIVPIMPRYYDAYFTFENKVGRVLYMSNYASFIDEEIVSRLCETNKNLIYSMDIFGIPKEEAVKEVQNKLMNAETNRYRWDQKQYANNNFNSSTPYETKKQIDQCNELLEDLVERDQKMMLCNIVLVHLADTLEELNTDSEILKTAASEKNCELSILHFASRQLDGLVTCLPIGVNKLNMYRTMITETAAAFIPFRAQEIIQPGGIWLGQNRITNNPIICNKEELENPNAFVLGIPGSGKSFISKEEIEFICMRTNDDVIVCDPEGEYTKVIKAMGGVTIQIGSDSNDHINAMDMSKGYGDDGNGIGTKSQFVISIFEQLAAEGEVVSSKEKSIIDRCVRMTYKEAKRKRVVPTLKTLRTILLKQPEPEANDLAIKLELLTEGSLNIFAHERNVDVNNRIISYDILNLGSQLKTIGLLVITDAIINRVNENWRKGKRTHVFIDEIHVIFQHKESATFFASAWRQFRKRNAYPTGITQNVSLLLNSEEGTSMLSNSQFIVLLNQEGPDRDRLANELKISEEELVYVTHVQKGTGLLKYGSSFVPFVNHIPKGPLYELNDTQPKKMMDNN